jgi:hypothetical protein
LFIIPFVRSSFFGGFFVKLPVSILSRLSFEVKEINAKSARKSGGVIAESGCLIWQSLPIEILLADQDHTA